MRKDDKPLRLAAGSYMGIVLFTNCPYAEIFILILPICIFKRRAYSCAENVVIIALYEACFQSRQLKASVYKLTLSKCCIRATDMVYVAFWFCFNQPAISCQYSGL